MVIIIYISTLASNEKFYLSTSARALPLAGIASFINLFLIGSGYLPVSTVQGIIASGSLYELGSSGALFFLMVYLLLTIVSVVKLVKFESGPLVARL